MEKVKVTKKDNFKGLADIVLAANISEEEKARYIDFINREVTLLEKKRVPTKAQKENENIKELIYNVILDAEAPITARAVTDSEEVAALETADGKEVSINKVTALITQLVKAGRVVKTTDKKSKTSVYSVADLERMQ